MLRTGYVTDFSSNSGIGGLYQNDALKALTAEICNKRTTELNFIGEKKIPKYILLVYLKN